MEETKSEVAVPAKFAKIVSEIEPELLFAVEKRMKGDAWHNGKFTVVPKVEENEGGRQKND